jgi:hypothetical protein
MIVFSLTLVAAGLCLIVKGPHLLRCPDNKFLWPLCLNLALVFVSSITGLPPVLDFLEGSTRILAIWVILPVAGAVTAARSMILLWAHPPQAARRKVRVDWGAYAAAAAVMVQLSLLGRHFVSSAEVTASRRTPESAWVAVPYVRDAYLVYCGFISASLVDMVLRLRRTAQLVDRRWLRRAMQALMAAGLLLLAYAAALAAYFLAYRFGVHLPVLQQVGVLAAGLGNLAAAAGFLLPLWGPRWERIRAYRHLEPLWLALSRANPEIMLEPPRLRLLDAWSPWRSDFRLYRRVIEIRDAIQRLRPYFDPELAADIRRRDEQAGLPEAQIDVTVAAAQLTSALREKTAGRTATGRSPAGVAAPDDSSLDAELAVLLPLARIFARRSSAPESSERRTAGHRPG